MNKTRNAYHIFIFAFCCILMTFIACESDDFKEDTHTYKHRKLDFTGVMVSIDSISNIKTTSKRHFKEKIRQLYNTKKNIHSETFGFSIDTTTVRLLRSDDFESYTFVVQREAMPNNVLENYILTYYSQNRYTQFLITYPIIQNTDGNSIPDVSNCTITNLNDTNLLIKTTTCASYAQERITFTDYERTYKNTVLNVSRNAGHKAHLNLIPNNTSTYNLHFKLFTEKTGLGLEYEPVQNGNPYHSTPTDIIMTKM